MSWVKIDDGLADHPKTIAAWEQDPAALGLLLRALAWCGKHETDGKLPIYVIRSWLPTKKTRDRLAKILVEVGFFEDDDEGYVVHDYLDRNFSKEELEERRQANRDRVAAYRARKKGERDE